MATLENFRLVVFRAVAELCSFRKAAEDLYLTQPAVSLQIKALEDDLGVQLFDRTGSRIALTAAGNKLFEYVQRAHALLAEAEDAVTSLGAEHSGHLALGASTTIANTCCLAFWANFAGRIPASRSPLSVEIPTTSSMLLCNSKVALGSIEGAAQNRDVKTESFLVDELVLIVPAAHERAERASIPCAEIGSTPLLMRERGSGSRRVVEMALEKHGLKRSQLQVVMELDSTEAIKSAVVEGLGVGFVSRWAIIKDQRTGTSFRVIGIEGMRVGRDLLIAYPSGPGPQGLAQEFRRFLSAHAGVRGPLRPESKK